MRLHDATLRSSALQTKAYSPKCPEEVFSEVDARLRSSLMGVLGSSAPHWGLLLLVYSLRARGWLLQFLLQLATAVHIVDLVSKVFILAFTTIELIPIPINKSSKIIVAIPAMEDILSLASAHRVVAIPTIEDIVAIVSVDVVGALAPVEHVLAPVGATCGAGKHDVEARPAVERVAA